MIYVAFFVALSALVPLGSAGGRQNTILFVLALAALFLFVGFRWQVGCDWTGYLNIFEITRLASVEEVLAGREAGFGLLNVLLHSFELDYFWVNAAGALFFFVGLYFFARREQNPLAVVALAFPILIVNMPMSGVRQGIAIGFFMLAINAYRDGNRWLYAAAILAGSTFHQSALIFLGLTPLIAVRKTVATIAFALILSLPAMYLIFTGAAGFYAERYVGGGDEAAGAPFRTALLGLTGLLFFVVLRKRWLRDHPDDYELYSLASVMMLAVLPIALVSSVVGDRIGYYLIPFQLVIFARIPKLMKYDAAAPVYAVLPYVGLLVFFLAWINLSPLFERCYLPYDSVLFGVE
ncbi:MAG: EpsG family protein [Alphaproteobacteria bacterium]|nr:EpsG family protein [Alphaproteobacteria bacterium]